MAPSTVDTFKKNISDISENGYAGSFIDRCFKFVLSRIHILKEKVPTVEKKPLRLAVPYLGTISLQTRTKLQKYIKGYLTTVNYRLLLKVNINSIIIFALNDPVQSGKDSAVCYHLLNCNYSPTFLCYENKESLLELKESFLLMRDRLSMNQNVCSAPLFLFE